VLAFFRPLRTKEMIVVGGESQKLMGIQVARALAALLVVVHHAMEISLASMATPRSPIWLTTAGAAGVDIFFVVSGFIMMVTAFSQRDTPDRPWSFIRKRIARIYPLYWFIAGIILIGWQLGTFRSIAPADPALSDLIRSFLLLPSGTLILYVSWTLVHEMNFYLLFALVLFTRSALACLFGVTGLVLLQLALGSYAADKALAMYLTRPILLEFCFGMALGYAHLNGVRLRQYPRLMVAVASAAMIFAPIFIPHEGTGGLNADDRVWAWGIPAALLIAACASWSVGNGVLGRVWIFLGDASYAIYLAHPFVMLAYAKALGIPALLQASQVPLIVAASIASAVLGVFVHLIIELPLSRGARRLLFRHQMRSTFSRGMSAGMGGGAIESPTTPPAKLVSKAGS
jgi:peptidoglycan/LPS O-acetylase OafA/YrhL